MLEHIPFIGDWHRSTKLGCGKFADIWLWQHAKSKEKIVVKTCHVFVGQNADKHKARWEREIELMTNKIRHLNIVRGLNVKPDSFRHELLKSNPSGALITEFCTGGDLRRQLNDNRHACGMPESMVRNIAQALTNATFYLHSMSIIHRDIKPENIVSHVTTDGRRIYKLTDLGCAKPVDFRCIEANLVGKMVYVAPELITTDKYTSTVDYWSLGMVIYEVITGYRAFAPHLPLAQWVLRVREKKSEHITIYENDAGDFIYSNKMYPENHISSKLSKLFELWFQLALEWNPKQRGYVFEKPPMPIPMPNLSTNNDFAPVQVLKFFQCVEEILAKKILTIFVLSSHRFFSMEIDDNTTNDDFFRFIEREAHIPITKCHVIGRTFNALNGTRTFDKPLDLYVEGYFDEPMVFLIKIDNLLPPSMENAIDDKPVPADVPYTVQYVLTNHEKRLNIHMLRKFACDTLHFVRTENRKYKLCLEGLFNFAMQLNSDIELCQQHVKQMQTLIYGAHGSLSLYSQTLQMMNETVSNFDVTWFDQCEKFGQNINRLVSACDKITLRYSSLYRRIRETSQNELLMKRAQDFYDLINVTKAYDSLRIQIANSSAQPKPHYELFQCAYKCLKTRDFHLRNRAFVELQRNLNGIHMELNEMKKALEKAAIPAEKYQNELLESNKKLHEYIKLSVAKCEQKPNTSTISTSTTDLTSANGINAVHTKDMIKLREKRQRDVEDHMKISKILIDDNIDLRIKMANMMNEVDEELKNQIMPMPMPKLNLKSI